MGKLIALSILLMAVFVYKISFLELPKPMTDHQFSLYRDQHGISHVYAKSKEEIYFGLGYAVGSDRLWTLFIKKKFLNGRLCQVFGKEALLSDLELRNIGYHQVGKMNAKLLDSQTRAQAQAYADGLNEYARSVKMLPFEFYLFGVEWEDWTVEDTLAMMAFFSFNLEFDWLYEIARQRLLETVGFDLGVKVITFGEQNLFRSAFIMNEDQTKKMDRFKTYDNSKQNDILREHWASKNITLDPIHIPQYIYEGSGSNGWIIGGQHTKSGKPIMANDPHLATFAPSMFYPIDLGLLNQDGTMRLQTFGFMADGLPSINIGVNKKYGWGSTAAYIDNKDIYHQTTRFQDGKYQYFHLGEWKDFEVRKQTFKVRFGQQVTKEFYHTHRGIVLQSIFYDIHFKFGYPLPSNYHLNHTLTINAAIYVPDNSSLKGLLGLAFAQTDEQMIQASDEINCPNIDSLALHANGTYGYVAVGRIPKRKIPEMGSFMKDGTTDIYDMGEFLNFSEKPRYYNPSKGYIAMANNKFAPDSFEFRSSLHEIVTGRAYRIQKLLKQGIEKKKKFTFDDMKTMQLDQKDEFVSEVVPGMLKRLRELAHIWSNNETEKYFKELQKWDFVMNADSIASSIYHAWEHIFHTSLFAMTNLALQQKQAIINHAFFQNYQFTLLQKFIKKNLTDEERIVCQSNQTIRYANHHPCQVSIALAFKALPKQLESMFNTNDMSQFKWGDIHAMIFKSIPFSQIPFIKRIWERSVPFGGSSRTLNVGIHTHQTKTYNAVGGAVARIISDLNRTIYNIDLGTSDRVFSKFYDNFLGNDEYIEYIARNPLQQGPIEGWQLLADTTHK